MINMRFQEIDLPIEIIREIEAFGQFALSWYLAKFGGEVRDLDDVYIKFSTPASDPGRYGAAQDNEMLDVLTIRTDAFNPATGQLTARGWDTVAHEFIHLCQYITDFERRYDVPYAQRPQEVQAFKYSSELVRAWRDNKISVAPDKPEEPNDINTNDTGSSKSTNNRRWRLGILLGVALLGALLLSGCAGKSFSDFLPSAAGAVGGAAGAAVCGPGCAAIGAGATAAGVEVAIPSQQQRALSDNPEVAKKQLEAEEREAFLRLIEKWGIYAMILFALVFWILPDPGSIFDRMRKK